MKKLIAKRTVLYLGRMYAPGEALQRLSLIHI